MRLVCIHDRSLIRDLLETDPYLNIYGIGDVDDLFWPYTCWYGLEDEKELKSAVCVYMGSDISTVLALSENTAAMSTLLKAALCILPYRFYAHLSPGLDEVFKKDFCFESNHPHFKMALTDTRLLESEDISQTVELTVDDIPALLDLYNDSYPGNWFEPEMLTLNRYYGIKDGSRLLAAAGTHVYSPSASAAAVGNIATRIECRGKGYGAKVTAALSTRLIKEGIRVGLNVQEDNEAAVSCYRKIGFNIHAGFSECTLRRRSES
ncbi:MAG TPA: GNAT family N-acetyltransferase [Spirochaeta sp.]|nr:GNAT family N-acetyltransferase [Spirochaeta sp.]